MRRCESVEAGPRCATAQKLQLRRLRELLAIGNQQWLSLLRRYGVTTAHALSHQQANELLRVLGKRQRQAVS